MQGSIYVIKGNRTTYNSILLRIILLVLMFDFVLLYHFDNIVNPKANLISCQNNATHFSVIIRRCITYHSVIQPPLLHHSKPTFSYFCLLSLRIFCDTNTNSCGPIPRAFRLPLSPCFQLKERNWISFLVYSADKKTLMLTLMLMYARFTLISISIRK